MKITFCGATRQVTGSCYLVETAESKVLIDCGLFQGGRIGEKQNLDKFPFNPKDITAVVLTHSHLDHSGRIPRLVRHGFRGPIYATNPTVKFAQLFLEDSVHILEQEAERHRHEPIYQEDDVVQASRQFEGVVYHDMVEIAPGISAQFFDAGHILGSASVRITAEGKSVVFSGDLGNPPVPILKPTESIDDADFVIMESTYGARLHEDKDNRRLILQSAIYETIIMKGVLMIPAFAMERTQEILYELNDMMNNNDIPRVPIFLDSPLAIRATRIFKEYEKHFNKEARGNIKSGDDIFHFPGLHMTLDSVESKAINDAPAPKVIIAGSGMAQGGRILHHIKRYIGHFANQYLIVGYQVEGSLGRRILDGEKTIKVHGSPYTVRAKVRAIGGYSSHADRDKLTTWVSEFDRKKLKKVFITHGEEMQSLELQRHFQQQFEFEPVVPTMLESFEL
ncbi:MAG: MBL fold metallo-hydrolase [Candidatus Kerfeldbacteria bacterium]